MGSHYLLVYNLVFHPCILFQMEGRIGLFDDVFCRWHFIGARLAAVPAFWSLLLGAAPVIAHSGPGVARNKDRWLSRYIPLFAPSSMLRMTLYWLVSGMVASWLYDISDLSKHDHLGPFLWSGCRRVYTDTTSMEHFHALSLDYLDRVSHMILPAYKIWRLSF